MTIDSDPAVPPAPTENVLHRVLAPSTSGVRDVEVSSRMVHIRAVITLALVALLGLVGGRFVFLFTDADRQNDVVQWVLRRGEFFVAPFFNLFDLRNEAAPGGGTFEFASLLAFAAYLTVGFVVLGAVSRMLRHGNSYDEQI